MLSKDSLLETGCFVDNEYLNKYIEFVRSAELSSYVKHVTQYHHVIPRSYKSSIKPSNIDTEYVVILKFSDHIIAHYYLSLCASTPSLIAANTKAICKMTNNNRLSNDVITKEWLQINCPLLQEQYEIVRKNIPNPMSVPEIKEKHDKTMRSEEVKSKIRSTVLAKQNAGLRFSDSTRKKISENTVGKIYIHKDGRCTKIYPEDLDRYIADGWSEGSGKKLSEEHKRILLEIRTGFKFSEESRKKMSESHMGKSPSNKGVPCSESTKKKISESLVGRKLMNDGERHYYVKLEDIDKYLELGFTLGKIKKGGDAE